jgi:hypothetical protein
MREKKEPSTIYIPIKEASPVTLLLYPTFYNFLCCFRLICARKNSGIAATLPSAHRQTLVLVLTVKKINDFIYAIN